MTELADMIKDELTVDDDSAFATPEAMRNAIRAVLAIPVPTRIGVAYVIARQLGLVAEVQDDRTV